MWHVVKVTPSKTAGWPKPHRRWASGAPAIGLQHSAGIRIARGWEFPAVPRERPACRGEGESAIASSRFAAVVQPHARNPRNSGARLGTCEVRVAA